MKCNKVPMAVFSPLDIFDSFFTAEIQIYLGKVVTESVSDPDNNNSLFRYSRAIYVKIVSNGKTAL